MPSSEIRHGGALPPLIPPRGQWCADNQKLLPDNQIAVAFLWKVANHVSANGSICLILPHGTLFNHNTTAVEFQKAWLREHTITRVLNLADFRWFLFDKAVHPAIVVSYKNQKPDSECRTIEYWAPKADWTATQAEVIAISPMDRSEILVGDLVKDLEGPDAPQTWKQRFWATPRDLRLLDRLSLYPRLRDHVRSSRESNSGKPWLMAEGFQPLGENDDPANAQVLKLPSKHFIAATSPDLDLFLLPDDCKTLRTDSVKVRNRSNKNTDIFRAPHVPITKGFQRIAFADFDVSFKHALRGIHGPESQRELLIFLAAYLRTPLAKYFMFHTSASWGMYRPEGHVEEVLRLPMPLPDQLQDSKRARGIVKEIAKLFTKHSNQVSAHFITRASVIQKANEEIESLVNEYFAIQPLEQILIADNLNIIIPSIQPTPKRMPVPTVKHSTKPQRDTYKSRVCEMLNGWAKGRHIVRGKTLASDAFGVGLVVLEKTLPSKEAALVGDSAGEILLALDRLRKISAAGQKAIDPIRGLMAFDGNQLYIVKPIGQRYWTETAALNDADEIAGTILMHSAEG